MDGEIHMYKIIWDISIKIIVKVKEKRMKPIAVLGSFILSQMFWHQSNYIECNCETQFFKNSYFLLKNMSLNIKIITKSFKSSDPLILWMSGRILCQELMAS